MECRQCQQVINIARHHFDNNVTDKDALLAQLRLECNNFASQLPISAHKRLPSRPRGTATLLDGGEQQYRPDLHGSTKWTTST
jgi:hypothetical protein